MKLSEYESFIKKLIPDLYRFSSILLPDELQSQQIVIDAISGFTVEYQKMLGELFFDRAPLAGGRGRDVGNDWSYARLFLFKKVYQLAARRIIQLGKSVDFCFNFNPKFHPYYNLELPLRAMLFLSHVEKMGVSGIEEVVELKYEEVLGGLERGRSQLITTGQI